MNKTPVLLIRGLLREERHWGVFPALMQRYFPENPILTLTVAGVGKRNHITSPSTISAMTDDLRNELERRYPGTEKVHLLGISMGGMISIDWASRFPKQIESVVVVNTSARPFSYVWERLRWQSYPTVMKSIFSDAKGQEANLLKLLSNTSLNEPVMQKTINDWGQWRAETPPSGKSIFNQLLACALFKASKKPDVPLLVIASSEDKMVSPSCSYQLADKWQLPLVKHPTSGHDVAIDDPKWLCEQMREFIG